MYSHLQKSPWPGESGLASRDWRTLGFCSWSGKSEGARAGGEVSSLSVGLAELWLLPGSLSWVAESILGYSWVLCYAPTRGTESTLGLRQQIPPSLLHQPDMWGPGCSHNQVSRFQGTTTTVEPHLHFDTADHSTCNTREAIVSTSPDWSVGMSQLLGIYAYLVIAVGEKMHFSACLVCYKQCTCYPCETKVICLPNKVLRDWTSTNADKFKN